MSARALRDRIREIDAMRPMCPTCGGTCCVAHPAFPSGDAPCPDCTDGRMSFERMAEVVQLLLDYPVRWIDGIPPLAISDQEDRP